MTASAHSDLGGNIGIGFAIPASPARPVTDELRSNGRVTRGYPGVTIQPVSKDAPAAKAGLKMAISSPNSPASRWPDRMS